jgi:hypothetical protein
MANNRALNNTIYSDLLLGLLLQHRKHLPAHIAQLFQDSVGNYDGAYYDGMKGCCSYAIISWKNPFPNYLSKNQSALCQFHSILGPSIQLSRKRQAIKIKISQAGHLQFGRLHCIYVLSGDMYQQLVAMANIERTSEDFYNLKEVIRFKASLWRDAATGTFGVPCQAAS